MSQVPQRIQSVTINKRIVKKWMFGLLLILITIGVVGVLVLNLNPSFGGNLTAEQQEAYKKYGNFVNGKFMNVEQTGIKFSLADTLSMLKDSLMGARNRNPNRQLSAKEVDWDKIRSEEDSLTWFGHSAFLLSLDNKKILVDPMLGARSSPFSIGGSKRYTGSLLHLIDDMPNMDAVFITHDHYDHLDYSSIVKLKDKTSHFFVPLGVGNHLVRWGIPQDRITELNWWEETEFKGLKVALTPSRHFSGRGLFNRDTTLWGGWVILGSKTRFFTSGDGGYGEHFREIGNRYGPFDITLIEGGQYDRRWSQIHMTPEESIRAHEDVKGKDMMLIHWGAFTLAFHGWTDPIERAINAANEANVNLLAPQLGETIQVNKDEASATPITSWWNE